MTDKRTIDEGLIVIKHLKLSEDSKGANRVSEYMIDNEHEHLYPSPIFNDNASPSFGHYFSINFVFPKTYQPDTLSKELTIDFDVTDKGLQNIKIVQGVDNEIDASTIKIIQKTNKKWIPIVVEGHSVTTTMRFHFIFFLGVTDLRRNF